MAHSYVRYDSFICATCLLFARDLFEAKTNESYKTPLIDMTYTYSCSRVLFARHFFEANTNEANKTRLVVVHPLDIEANIKRVFETNMNDWSSYTVEGVRR